MRIYKLIALLCSVFLFSCASNTTPKAKTGMKYSTGTYEKILKLAKSQNKPIFIDFHAEWCGPCKVFDKEVLGSKKVYDYMNQNFINYSVDAEKGEGPDLAFRYIVDVYPTIFFVDPNGNILETYKGMPTTSELMRMGNAAIKKLP